MPSFAEAKSNLQNINKINDYSQSELRRAIPGYTLGGFCAPTAASNIMKRFHRSKNVDQVEIIKTLSSPEYMNTVQGQGTKSKNFLKGIRKYMEENFMGYDYLRYQAPYRLANYNKAGNIPDPKWIAEGVGLNKGAWISFLLVKHNKENNDYEVLSGHMVTVVGYLIDRKNTILIINDGADKSKDNAVFLNLEQIKDGNIVGSSGQKFSASGFWKIKEGGEDDTIHRFGRTVGKHRASYATQDYDTLIIDTAIRVKK